MHWRSSVTSILFPCQSLSSPALFPHLCSQTLYGFYITLVLTSLQQYKPCLIYFRPQSHTFFWTESSSTSSTAIRVAQPILTFADDSHSLHFPSCPSQSCSSHFWCQCASDIDTSTSASLSFLWDLCLWGFIVIFVLSSLLAK